MRPSEWIEKNRGRLVRRVAGKTVYRIKAYNTTYPTRGTKIILEKDDGTLSSASFREAKRMVSA